MPIDQVAPAAAHGDLHISHICMTFKKQQQQFNHKLASPIRLPQPPPSVTAHLAHKTPFTSLHSC